MQPEQDTISIDDVVVRGSMAARRIADDLSWGDGAIQPRADHTSAEDQKKLIAAVLDNIQPVDRDELAYSSCTDGRYPVALKNGDKVPVREQVVGADMVSAFYVAESLGSRFYKDAQAPVAARVLDVAQFLHENGLLPSSHIACGAAGGFVAITENVTRYSKYPVYIERLQTLLPEGTFDEAIHTGMLDEATARLAAHVYDGLTIDVFLDAVEKVSGVRAIAELRDDGQGVHGHLEEAIVRVRVPGKAIDEAGVAEEVAGRQVFGVNDNRMERLARLFARGNDEDYRIAAMALEDFASSGHGTLAKGLPTYIVTVA